MNIMAERLEVLDIKDYSKSWEESQGINTSVQNSLDTPTNLRLGDPSKGTTNLSANFILRGLPHSHRRCY